MDWGLCEKTALVSVRWWNRGPTNFLYQNKILHLAVIGGIVDFRVHPPVKSKPLNWITLIFLNPMPLFENIIAFWRNLGKRLSFDLIIYGHIFYKSEKLNKSQCNSNHRVLCQVSFPFSCFLQIFSFPMCKRYMGNQKKYLLLVAHWLDVLPIVSCSMLGWLIHWRNSQTDSTQLSLS